jgi:hypothetical protein
MPYKYVLDAEVAEMFVQFSRARRESLLQIFRFLANEPNVPAELAFKDDTGRDISTLRTKHWIIYFWADHAVQEVRIIGIRTAR